MSFAKTPFQREFSRLPMLVAAMLDLFVSILAALWSLPKSEHDQALEILALRR